MPSGRGRGPAVASSRRGARRVSRPSRASRRVWSTPPPGCRRPGCRVVGTRGALARRLGARTVREEWAVTPSHGTAPSRGFKPPKLGGLGSFWAGWALLLLRGAGCFGASASELEVRRPRARRACGWKGGGRADGQRGGGRHKNAEAGADRNMERFGNHHGQGSGQSQQSLSVEQTDATRQSREREMSSRGQRERGHRRGVLGAQA